MATDKKDKLFKQPKDINCKLWRYMDFTKFVSMISSSCLYLHRTDLFPDPYEGTLASKDEYTKDQLKHNIPWIKEFRQCTYINCWHMNEFESAAMWNLYSSTNESIAIETNYKQLKNLLPNSFISIGIVNYIDYEKEKIPKGDLINLFMHKRISFEHEKEVRLLINNFNLNNIDLKKGALKEDIKENSIKGINVPISDISELINCIHVSPTAENWFFELVKKVVREDYNLNIEVRKSDLYKNPELLN